MDPTKLYIGDTWKWDRVVSDYPPSDGWALAYALNGPAAVTDIAATTAADGDHFEIEVPAATTAGYTPGTYALHAIVAKGADRHTISVGVVHLVENFDASQPQKSFAEQRYDALNQALVNNPMGAVVEISVNGRTTKFDRAAAQAELNLLADQIRMERNPGRLPGSVVMTFGGGR